MHERLGYNVRGFDSVHAECLVAVSSDEQARLQVRLKASVKHVAEMVQEMLMQFISIERFHSYGRLFLCFWAFCYS